MNLQQILALKNKVESLRRKADEMKGAQDQLQKQLKKDYGCETVEDARKLLRKMKKEQEKLEKQYEEEMNRFHKKWEGKI